MAVIRLDVKPDKIEDALFSSLMDSVSSSRDRSTGAITDPLASSTWEGVAPNDTLVTPVRCKTLWRQFEAETDCTVAVAVAQAISAQEAVKPSNVKRGNKRWLSPPWVAGAGLATLGIGVIIGVGVGAGVAVPAATSVIVTAFM